MKSLTKPMSSPGRTEKFPPPLMMRFLRTNIGSRSRGRSRASPIFIRKKHNPPPIETTQEPSSPKVTCIGQVRARRSSAAARKKSLEKHPCSCSCSWVRNTLFCPKKLRPRSIGPDWSKCNWFFPFGCCRKSKARDDSAKIEPTMENKNRASDSEDEDEAEVREESREAFASTSPPKNAFLLTRCRSAPYRSSSLANRFWGSPLEKSEAEDDNGERPTSESEASCRNSALESKLDREIEGRLGFLREIEGSINGIAKEIRPGTLTRCKSEPARTGERLNPERKRRFGIALPRSPHVCD
ncbi:hypothetical protein CEY00_Acc27464 [Actinidia chinensis var. chinensis]|uniref:Uncharacterized protein n=1 Tax=Actinidia chinensis var. chinensis TaxID=1590841 RepID=A0A2R6PKJ5_ACTCC|nr:hypothetical protein CEY00_Acc27464 [Actinidia chinensis var. chinensis]